MPTTPVTCPLDCADACGVLVESDDRGRFVALRGNPAHGYSNGHLCGKTAIYGDLITSAERLLAPLVRDGDKRDGQLRPATWDEAIARIVERVEPLKAHGEQILGAWYAGTMGRIQRWFPLRMLNALGATVIDGGLCDNSTTAGYECVLGDVYGADIERADEADLLVLWGCDMVRTVQHLQPAAQRLCKRGVPVIAIDIYRTDTIRALERWGGRGLVVAQGTDAMLALALARLAFERGAADRKFLKTKCVGASEFEAHVLASHDLDSASRVTGVPRAEIERLFERLARAKNPLLKTGVGFGRRRNGAMQMRAVCSLAAVLGRADRVHYESFSTFNLANDAIERPDLRPAKAKRDVIKQVQFGRELESGRFRAVFVWAHNPAVVCPESARVRAGLARDDVFVVVHEQFLTETAQLADVVLPSTMFAEHADVYRSYGHRRLQFSQRACDPPSGPRSIVDAFAAIAHGLKLPPATWDVTSESLCDELIAASPSCADDIVRAQLHAGLPAKLEPPHGVGHGTPSGKVELFSSAAAVKGQPAMASHVADDACGDTGAFWLISAPSVHTHNSTFSHSARHIRRRGAHKVFMHPGDAQRLGLAAGELVTLFNRRGAVSFPLAVSDDMCAGSVRIDGLPQAKDTPERIGVNALVAGELSDLGDNNVLYSTRVDVRRAR
jgi:anaerobic selenocysteine-containing dehydrogenase